MKSIQLTMGAAVLVLAVLLLTTKRAEAPAYDVAREVAIAGVVQDVQNFYCPVSMDEGIHLMLRTEQGSVVEVHVAPSRYLRGNSISFAAGDNVEVVGAYVNEAGGIAILARKISRRGETFSFRTMSGKPLWRE